MPRNPINARRCEVANLLRHAATFGLSRAAKQRLAWFAYALAHEGNVSLTCRYFGISRATFLRWAKRFDPRRPETLEEHSRRPHSVRAPETDSRVVALIRDLRKANPTMGKVQIAQTLASEHSVVASASTVGRVIEREKLFFADTPSHRRKRAGTDFVIDRISPFSTPASPNSSQESGEAGALPAIDLPVFGS